MRKPRVSHRPADRLDISQQISHNFTGLLTGLLTGGGVLAKGRPLGIITDPGYVLYVEADCGCFPGGRVPKKLFASVTGLSRGDLWTPGLPEPPNGIHIIEFDHPCLWGKNASPFIFEWYSGFGWTRFYIRYGSGDFAFVGYVERPCAASFPNLQLSENVYYYGGSCAVTQREPIL